MPEDERFELNLPDIAEVWRRGSVISSWLLLAAQALAGDPSPDQFTAVVADGGEGPTSKLLLKKRFPRMLAPAVLRASGRATPKFL